MSTEATLLRVIRHSLCVRLLEVRTVERLTPLVARVTLAGPELAGFVTLSPEDHVKVFFPAPGEERPILPNLVAGELKRPPAGSLSPIARDYTPRRYDAEKGELVIDFLLHGRGVASCWAAQARAGQRLGVAGPRGSLVLEGAFDWYLLVGDETALPAIARRLEEFPAGTRALAVIQVSSPAERQALPARSGQEIAWVECPEETRLNASALADRVAALTIPGGRGFAWVAGEASEVRAVYRHLLNDRKLPREQIHVSGHWRRGVSNHDHHAPIDG